MSTVRPQDLVERALAASAADDCVAIATATHAANMRWANNTLTTNGVVRSLDLTVVSILRDGDRTRMASLSRSGVALDDVADLAAASHAAAAAGQPVDDAAPFVDRPADPRWDEPPAETSLAALGTVAEGLAAAFDNAAQRGEGRFGYAEHGLATVYVATSSGLRLRDAQPDGRVELTGRSADGARSSWAGNRAAHPADLDVGTLERDVVRRLDWSRRRADLAPGRYTTILPPSAVADLMVETYWSMGALDAHEGSTAFSAAGAGTRVGEQLTGVPLTLRSDPTMAGQECTPFVVAPTSSRLSSVFDNGMALGPTSWVEDGVLRALLQTRHTAGVTGLPVTPYVDNLELVGAGAADDLDAIVASTERGLLLTCLWYIREVDPQALLLTGLTRDGVFLVEGGEVVGAVTNFRFNESPVAMLRRVSAVGRTEPAFAREFGDYFTRTRMPALRIDEFNMSSVSKAS